MLLAPTSRGGWTIGAWNGSAWFDLCSGRVLDPQIYVALPRLRVGNLGRSAPGAVSGAENSRGYQAAS